jgi:hypothetical protein
VREGNETDGTDGTNVLVGWENEDSAGDRIGRVRKKEDKEGGREKNPSHLAREVTSPKQGRSTLDLEVSAGKKMDGEASDHGFHRGKPGGERVGGERGGGGRLGREGKRNVIIKIEFGHFFMYYVYKYVL